MSYKYFPSTMGDSSVITANGSRVSFAAPASAGRGGGGGGQSWRGGPVTARGGGNGWQGYGTNTWKNRRQRQQCPTWCATVMANGAPPPPPCITCPPPLNYAPGTNVPNNGWTGPLMGLGGLGILRAPVSVPGVFGGRGPVSWSNPLLPVVSPYRPVAPVAPIGTQLATIGNKWKTLFGGQPGRSWQNNNRRGGWNGVSNYAPWNQSPTCSDPTSQYYDPSDPSCSTGNNPICTDPTYPGYNPNDPSCAGVANAANTATSATAAAPVSGGGSGYGEYLLIGGGVLLLILLMKK